MEKSRDTGIVRIFEQAVDVVEDIGDNVINCEVFRAWDELTYPLLYTTSALWSGAAAAMIQSATQIMAPAADGGARLH
ncbi:hypothetical protein K9U39_10150 [Rhodoblastus acidophilus]|uniref:Uncharacterized protein n=1 Tax=Candidatus Rhodoblastus alkanivorans TaxID=2954117 RepID=A0ABS9Z8N0_9HYPH|nr:hypothetical protein [Candidatus Rhodoblastus alkanivorans]MCI4680563.1 hypothetical protein [Candidatus Rhodoblastus alkanivorans]MCI4683974.1 hypothetical protein [Candidatus Rhodoblastus alkanivorans]MDI4641293.1 hypothetical protein [Rhodoblastus acidophilus]